MRRVFTTVLIASLVCLGAPGSALAAARDTKQHQRQNPAETGNVEGVAKNAEQRNLPSVRIHVRAPNGQLVGAGTTSNSGAFSFTGLSPATYTIEIVSTTGEIVGTASVAVTAGATTTVTLTANALGTIASAAASGAGLLGLGPIATVAVIGAAGAAAVTGVVTAKKDASPSR